MSDTPETTITVSGAPITPEMQQIFGSFYNSPVQGLTTHEALTGGQTGILVTYADGFQLLFVPYFSVEVPGADGATIQ